ncbi:MAG: GNAT family N-acetyltransferase [Candidatus Thorarchaeota archaeon]|jgi:ribosomal protein S18 acetylase RimI-like enzyme
MVRTVLRKWEELDIKHLAEITSETRRYEGLGDYTVDQVEEYLRNINDRFPAEIAVVAIENEKIIGWMSVERVTEQIGEIGRWQPFVSQGPDRDKLAQHMIAKSSTYARENGIRRMEIGFGEISEPNLETYNQRQDWYESEGWNKLEDNNFMVTNPMVQRKLEEPKLPDGFSLQPLLEEDNDNLFQCYHEAFTSGKALWIYDLTEAQIRQEFDKNFDRSRPINGDASFVVVQERAIAGFILVVSRSEEEEHVESIGVHPSYRGKGLAKILLWRSMEVLRKSESENLTLGVDTVNIPAVKLYELFGFETVSRTARYSWKVVE